MQLEYKDMGTDLRLCPGGKLYYRKWFMDERKGKVFDVSDRPLKFLMHDCELDPAVTLRDVFDLIEANLDDLEPILGNWVKEFVEESKQPYKPKEDRELERLELYWFLESDAEFGTDGMAFPSFHGIGKNGDKYGVDFSSCHTLMELPLTLKEDAEIYHRDQKYKSSGSSMVVLPKVGYTLMGILYGIIWELSFFGPPKKRDEEVKKLMAIAEDARLHPENLIPLDEVMNKIKEKQENPKKVAGGLDTADTDGV